MFGRDRPAGQAEGKFGVGSGTSTEQNYWFRLLDVENAKGLVWMHQIPDDFAYRLDKPFFHEFSGKVSTPYPNFQTQTQTDVSSDQAVWVPLRRGRGSKQLLPQSHQPYACTL